ncbi:MAG: hypothetical protein JST09_03745 [Bacteroidetes bacterium]|nr:hypothetical protein [Bacteroidota bacterium]
MKGFSGIVSRLIMLSGILSQSSFVTCTGFFNGLKSLTVNGFKGSLSISSGMGWGGLILSGFTEIHFKGCGSLNLKGLLTGCAYPLSSIGKGIFFRLLHAVILKTSNKIKGNACLMAAGFYILKCKDSISKEEK